LVICESIGLLAQSPCPMVSEEFTSAGLLCVVLLMHVGLAVQVAAAVRSALVPSEINRRFLELAGITLVAASDNSNRSSAVRWLGWAVISIAVGVISAVQVERVRLLSGVASSIAFTWVYRSVVIREGLHSDPDSACRGFLFAAIVGALAAGVFTGARTYLMSEAEASQGVKQWLEMAAMDCKLYPRLRYRWIGGLRRVTQAFWQVQSDYVPDKIVTAGGHWSVPLAPVKPADSAQRPRPLPKKLHRSAPGLTSHGSAPPALSVARQPARPRPQSPAPGTPRVVQRTDEFIPLQHTDQSIPLSGVFSEDMGPLTTWVAALETKVRTIQQETIPHLRQEQSQSVTAEISASGHFRRGEVPDLEDHSGLFTVALPVTLCGLVLCVHAGVALALGTSEQGPSSGTRAVAAQCLVSAAGGACTALVCSVVRWCSLRPGFDGRPLECTLEGRRGCNSAINGVYALVGVLQSSSDSGRPVYRQVGVEDSPCYIYYVSGAGQDDSYAGVWAVGLHNPLNDPYRERCRWDQEVCAYMPELKPQHGTSACWRVHDTNGGCWGVFDPCVRVYPGKVFGVPLRNLLPPFLQRSISLKIRLHPPCSAVVWRGALVGVLLLCSVDTTPRRCIGLGAAGGLVYSILRAVSLRFDDPIEAVAVFGSAGLVGLLCRALFGLADLAPQLAKVLTVSGWAVACSLVVFVPFSVGRGSWLVRSECRLEAAPAEPEPRPSDVELTPVHVESHAMGAPSERSATTSVQVRSMQVAHDRANARRNLRDGIVPLEATIEGQNALQAASRMVRKYRQAEEDGVSVVSSTGTSDLLRNALQHDQSRVASCQTISEAQCGRVAITEVFVFRQSLGVTAAGHGFKTGDVVEIQGVHGWSQVKHLINAAHVAQVIDKDTIVVPVNVASATGSPSMNGAFVALADGAKPVAAPAPHVPNPNFMTEQEVAQWENISPEEKQRRFEERRKRKQKQSKQNRASYGAHLKGGHAPARASEPKEPQLVQLASNYKGIEGLDPATQSQVVRGFEIGDVPLKDKPNAS